jgi:tetratricopeptide (TPR) repeat protein
LILTVCRDNRAFTPYRRPSVKSILPALLILLAAHASEAPATETPNKALAAVAWQSEWLARAASLERNKDWQGLLDLGRRWIQIEPANATAWFVLGRANSSMKRFPEAIAAYQQNLNLDPGDVSALNNLGNAYRDSKQLRDAIAVYRHAVQIAPDYIPTWHNLSIAFYDLKGAAGVTLALQKLDASYPEAAEAWRRLVIEYALSRDARVAKKAIEVLRGLDADKRRLMLEALFVSI